MSSSISSSLFSSQVVHVPATAGTVVYDDSRSTERGPVSPSSCVLVDLCPHIVILCLRRFREAHRMRFDIGRRRVLSWRFGQSHVSLVTRLSSGQTLTLSYGPTD